MAKDFRSSLAVQNDLAEISKGQIRAWLGIWFELDVRV